MTMKRRCVGQFEAAVEAVVNGRLSTLKRLLRDNPELIRARSRRKHRSTLLHYVGANGEKLVAGAGFESTYSFGQVRQRRVNIGSNSCRSEHRPLSARSKRSFSVSNCQ